MAGNYADVPGHRFAYDKDGTVVEQFQSGVPLGLSAGQIAAFNSDITPANYYWQGDPARYFVFIFPQTRTLTGYFVTTNGAYGAPSTGQYSTNTTTGLDGTWTSIPGYATSGNADTRPTYRTAIQVPTPITGINAVRLSFSPGRYGFDDRGVNTMHLYGLITGSGNRLALWHPTLDQEVGGAYFDWGNVPRGYTFTRQFRVKNVGTLTANTSTVNLETIHDATPAVLPQHALSFDGSAYSSSVSIGTLAPDAISGVVTLRYIVDPVADLSVYTLRIRSVAASWS